MDNRQWTEWTMDRMDNGQNGQWTFSIENQILQFP